jgi:glucan 1,3-beta-glucosidase
MGTDKFAVRLNHVRLPIGYWAFDVGPDEPFISGQIPYMEKAVTWAKNHGLKLILDLHGAPGSQNGRVSPIFRAGFCGPNCTCSFDNSGQKMSYPMWHTNQTNINRTNKIIKTIADMYKDQVDTVAAIAPLNE